jgi:hypothetical protein
MIRDAAATVRDMALDPDGGDAYYEPARDALLCGIYKYHDSNDVLGRTYRDTFRNTLMDIMLNHAKDPEDFNKLFATLALEYNRKEADIFTGKVYTARIFEKMLFEVRNKVNRGNINPASAAILADVIRAHIEQTQTTNDEYSETRAALNALTALIPFAPQHTAFLTDWVTKKKPHHNDALNDMARILAEYDNNPDTHLQILPVFENALDDVSYFYEDIAAVARGLAAVANSPEDDIANQAQSIILNAIKGDYANPRARPEGVQALRIATMNADNPVQQIHLLSEWQVLLDEGYLTRDDEGQINAVLDDKGLQDGSEEIARELGVLRTSAENYEFTGP